MNDIQSKINAFKQIVIENCKNENFEYREWFIPDHLMIVEKIAMELCDVYKEADRDVVLALVWFHDFGKPIDEKNEREVTKVQGVEAMRQVGLHEEFIENILKLWTRMEMKNEIDISEEDIEVQIVSTADGASHFVGKFHATYFMDDGQETLKNLEERIGSKIKQDWERKIVLPEVKKAFLNRYLRALEITGEYPNKFI